MPSDTRWNPGPATTKLKSMPRVILEWFLTAAITIALVAWLSLTVVTDRADNLLYDTFSRWNSPAASDDIVIIGIDDRSLAALGPWPWPRSVHARLIDQLSAQNSGPIAYDVLFLEPTAEDDVLATSIRQAGNVWLATLITDQGFNGQGYAVTEPASEIAEAAAGLGHVVLTPDSDGTVRHMPLWAQAGPDLFADLIVPLVEREVPLPSSSGPQDALSITGETLIRFPSEHSGFKALSFIDVLNGEIPDDFITGRKILVGATAYGMGDRYSTTTTPDDTLTPGVEIQAALLQTLMQDNAPQVVPPALRLMLSLMPLGLMLAGFLTLRPIGNTALGLVLLLGCVGGSAIALQLGWWWPPVPAIIGVFIAWPIWSWRRLAATYSYIQSELERLPSHAGSRQIAALSPLPVWSSGDPISQQVSTFSSALKQLRDFNQFITQSVQSLPDAAVITDAEDVVVMANTRARRLFHNKALEGIVLRELLTALGHKNWTVTSGDSEDLITPSGTALQVAAAPLTDTLGQPAGSIIRFADVTHIRAAERQREMTLQLLGHDMRAPQVSILTLLDNPVRPDNFEDRIRANAKQTLGLADGYVQLSRAENQTLRYDSVDLGMLLTEAADMMWPQAAAKGVDLISPDDLDQDTMIEGDSALLRRVLVNLLDNAIRHTPVGMRVLCDVVRQGEHVMITIADEGPGFDAETMSSLFQPFQGGANIAGAGLGLAFVRTVVLRHGGSIELTSPNHAAPPTSGACFYITLPVTRVADSAQS